MDVRFYTAQQLADMLGVGIGKGYALIRDWNKELRAKGYTTVQGRVVRAYANKRLGLEITDKKEICNA